MRLANLAAFQRYARGLEQHKIPMPERLERLDRALEFSDRFLSSREFLRCAEFISNYQNQGDL